MKSTLLHGDDLVRAGLEEFIDFADVSFSVYGDGTVECYEIFGRDHILTQEEKENLTTSCEYDREPTLPEDFFEED